MTAWLGSADGPTREVVYIIAGGPSLAGFAFDRLGEGWRLSVNRTFAFTRCDAMVSIDKTWLLDERYAAELAALRGVEVVIGMTPRYIERMTPPRLPHVTWVARDYSATLTDDPRLLTCGLARASNSTIAALSLARHRRARHIVILGADFSDEPARTHWYETADDQPRDVRDGFFRLYAPQVDRVIAQLEGEGVEVIVGTNGATRITAGRHVPLAEIR